MSDGEIYNSKSPKTLRQDMSARGCELLPVGNRLQIPTFGSGDRISMKERRRSENIAFKVMPNGNIRAYQADKPDKRGVSELQFTNPENESPTVIVGNTIKVIEKSMCVKESKNDPRIIQAGTIVYPDHSGEHQQDFVQHADGISRAIPAGTHASTPHLLKTYIPMTDKKEMQLPQELKGKKFRIRKLTPTECFRLMGVGDKDIETIRTSGVSNSAQYKLAGNSIVAGGNYKDGNGNWDGVLFNLFRKMFIDNKEPDFDGTPVQLTLF